MTSEQAVQGRRWRGVEIFHLVRRRPGTRVIVRAAGNPDARSINSVSNAIITIADGIQKDPALVARIDGWVTETACYLVERYRGDVADIIAETVAGWDPAVTSERIELAVGPDLQYIRINGTFKPRIS